MAGAVGIVFGLCVLSFTLGAALMYVVTRRREDASETPPAPAVPAPAVSRSNATWVPRPASVEPVEDDYDSRPIHRAPVTGLPRAEPALAAFAEPVVEEEPAPALPPPAVPQLVEHTTASERDDFRQRYLRTFEEARRKASSN